MMQKAGVTVIKMKDSLSSLNLLASSSAMSMSSCSGAVACDGVTSMRSMSTMFRFGLESCT
jgi:hypothetical protein